MKKNTFVIIGFLIGILVSVSMINNRNLAYSNEEADFAQGMYSVSFSDIWNSAFHPGHGLYSFLRSSLAYQPADKAINVVAESYGFTKEEASAVLAGTPTPFLNRGGGPSFTIADATAMTQKFISDYETLYDIYDLQQDIEIEVGTTEIFQNGDLADSGFDLIVDLGNIEYILFGAESESTMGGDFEDEMEHPFTIDLLSYITPDEEPFDDSNSPITINDYGVTLNVGDKKLDKEKLDEDVCPVPNIYGDAAGAKDAKDAKDEEPPEDPDKDPAKLPTQDPVVPLAPGIPEVPPGDYDKVFCIGMDEQGVKTGADAVPSGEVNSSGGVSGSWTKGGEDKDPEDAVFTLNASICFDMELIYEKYSSKNVGDVCIICYIKQINEELDKVVSGSLLPNKSTGNMLESGKCKETGAFIGLSVVAVPVAVPTPLNDDIIFGNNFFEEWNKFVDRVNVWPFNSSARGQEKTSKFSTAPLTAADNSVDSCSKSTGEMTQLDLFNCMNSTLSKASASVENDVDVYNQSSSIDNAKLFTDKLSLELKQTNAFFINFKNTYGNTTDDGTNSILEVLDELNKKDVK